MRGRTRPGLYRATRAAAGHPPRTPQPARPPLGCRRRTACRAGASSSRTRLPSERRSAGCCGGRRARACVHGAVPAPGCASGGAAAERPSPFLTLCAAPHQRGDKLGGLHSLGTALGIEQRACRGSGGAGGGSGQQRKCQDEAGAQGARHSGAKGRVRRGVARARDGGNGRESVGGGD